jgi:hypothetical protein
MIDYLFNICVNILIVIGEITGWGYKLSNLIIFVFVQPLLIILFFTLWLRLKLTNLNFEKMN